MLLLNAYPGRPFSSDRSGTFRRGLQANIQSGNLGRLISENGYQSRLQLSKFGSDSTVVRMDDDSSTPDVGDARLARQWRYRLEQALKL